MDQAIKDGIYLAIVIIVALIFLRIFLTFGVLILAVAIGYYIYKRFIKKDGGDIYHM